MRLAGLVVQVDGIINRARDFNVPVFVKANLGWPERIREFPKESKFNPGEATAYLTSHSEKQKKVRSFHPPRIVANYLPDFHSPV
jgi:hypothetical protein